MTTEIVPAAGKILSSGNASATAATSGQGDPLLDGQRKAWLPACFYHPLSEQIGLPTSKLYVSGMVQAAKKDDHALGAVATLCLLEFIAAIALGGVMTVCVTGSLWWLIAPVSLIVLMVLTWGLTFKYPNWLRSFIWSTCFRHKTAAVDGNQ